MVRDLKTLSTVNTELKPTGSAAFTSETQNGLSLLPLQNGQELSSEFTNPVQTNWEIPFQVLIQLLRTRVHLPLQKLTSKC